MSTSLPHSNSGKLDLLNKRPFSSVVHEILAYYEGVVDGLLAIFIGGHCEIVLHFMENLKCSAVRIANGEHTGRKVGSPILDLALRMIYNMDGEDSSVSRVYLHPGEKRRPDEIRHHCYPQSRAVCDRASIHQYAFRCAVSQIIQTVIPPETQDITTSVNDLVAQTLEFTIEEEVNADRNVSNHVKNRQIMLFCTRKTSLPSRTPSTRSPIGSICSISSSTRYVCISVSLKAAIL